jgi:CubicO group peptidase (beta-lactamase class C family)
MVSGRHLAKKPEDVGVDSERLEALFARVRRDVDEGLLSSAQVAVARHGKVAGLRTFGRALHGESRREASDHTLYPLFSCTKGIVGVTIWALFEEGLLRPEERVADIIPEFGTNGKDIVTVEQVLLHVSGFPHANIRPEEWHDRDRRLAAFAKWRLGWEPGSRFEYHITSAHWVLAEIIQRRTGKDYRDFIRERLTAPMGLGELFVGAPPEVDDRVADFQLVTNGEPVAPPEGWGVGEVTPRMLLSLNEPRHRRVGVPGGGAVGGAAELALFYQTLINGGETPDGKRVFKPETIAAANVVRTTEEHRDPMYGNAPVNRGLGLIVAGGDGFAHFRSFGKTTSPRAFGHPGAGGQIAWGDPESGISLGYCMDGFADWMVQGRRTTAISSLAGSCAQA